ncbi:uncharacterized protein F4822DRAFT_100305 [Hypoxylon trugodes]|uniref:uncharacterized protein n=1 Tax=Hypoxylon trugodes TaxID=326681 RepID=UPI002190ADAB|nr:uncharacterized protein F4822DRAFT_100305 [Hypoxylon trugodes]KAI1382891.1 hypothetical protein F4822DRAFT_100305 [Hypoxylon trugodes]
MTFSTSSATAGSTTSSTISLTTHIKATYTNSRSTRGTTSLESSLSSTTGFALSLPLSLPSTDSTTAQKTTYLSELREAVSSLQERMNSELTTRMEVEAKEAAATISTTSNAKGNKTVGASAVDEAAEEENYGEEVVEGDEE